MDKKRLIVFDGNAIVHRAFHALPPLTTKKYGIVNAVYGFLLVFLRVARELKPDFMVAAFDFPAPSFRHIEYKPYKAKRKKAPQELYDQIPKIKELLDKLGVKVLEKEGYEADDIMATLAKNASKKNIETIIVSGDLDSLQAVDKNTKVYFLRKGVKDIVLCDEKFVAERYGGITPSQMPDFKGLRGDASDNIPGVFGIGEKTAIILLQKFKTLENLYKELGKNSKGIKDIRESVLEKLLKSKEQAFLSKRLGKLNIESPIDLKFEDFVWLGFEKNKAAESLEDYGFHSLAERLNGQNKAAKKAEVSEFLEKKIIKGNKPVSENNLKLL